jgi:hypothetical protein
MADRPKLSLFGRQTAPDPRATTANLATSSGKWGEGADTFTLDRLKQLMDAMPPRPFLGSSWQFPAGHFIKFTQNRTEFFLAHPDQWAAAAPALEKTDAGGLLPSWAEASFEIVDLDSLAGLLRAADVLDTINATLGTYFTTLDLAGGAA